MEIARICVLGKSLWHQKPNGLEVGKGAEWRRCKDDCSHRERKGPTGTGMESGSRNKGLALQRIYLH